MSARIHHEVLKSLPRDCLAEAKRLDQDVLTEELKLQQDSLQAKPNSEVLTK